MPQWLFQQVGNNPNPIFALQSSLNWIFSLGYEVNSTFGNTSNDQVNQLNSNSNIARVQQHSNFSNVNLGEVFEPLFHGINFTLALGELNKSANKPAWLYPTGIISWYYAHYHCFRALNIALTSNKTDSHSALIDALNNFRKFLPHPYDMLAKYVSGEDFDCRLPSFNHTSFYELTKSFETDSNKSRGMLLSYLKGTAAWEVWDLKEEIKSKKGLKDFRTNANKAIRDQQIQSRLGEINFMNCAFRYRGKGNYRDALFLTYGAADSRFNGQFISSLFTTSRFVALATLIILRKRLNQNIIDQFKTDVSANLRHNSQLQVTEKFWELC